ncbi:MAG: hypothetical protein WDZ62_00690 [Candidatus Pacearchaeota archaeon]
MPTQNTSEIKNKIISILRKNGPSLPVHISKEIQSNSLFTSAFLSELSSEKKIRMSNMKIGSSSLYFLPGQEKYLDKFSHHLKSKEKEAYDILKNKKILKDSEQEPAIRVALRALKDFAIPYKKGEEIFWRFFNISEDEVKDKKTIEKTTQIPVENAESKNNTNESLNIFDKNNSGKDYGEKIEKEKISKKKRNSGKTSGKNESDFFMKIKSFLEKNSIVLLDILNFNKKEIILRVEEESEEKILIAYDKKRVNEKDIIKSFDKTKEFGEKYIILIKGSPYKKTKKLLDAVRGLDSVKNLK